MTDGTEYPSPREALFGNGHVANLYCALKWATWQWVHFWLAVVYLLFFVPAGWVGRRMDFQPPRMLVVAGALLTAALDALYETWPMRVVRRLTWYAMLSVGAAVLGPFIIVDKYLYQGSWLQRLLHRSADTAKETPGVRRVYGECPVSVDMEPRWFERLVGRFEP